jgi:hypothetical protein
MPEPTEDHPQIDFYEAVVDSLRYPVEGDSRTGNKIIDALRAELEQVRIRHTASQVWERRKTMSTENTDWHDSFGIVLAISLIIILSWIVEVIIKYA